MAQDFGAVHPMSFDSIFGTTGDVDALQECARAILIFCYGLVLVRLAGRRVFGKWAALDIVVSIVIGSNLSRALTGGAELGGTLLATTVLLLLHWVFGHAAARWSWLSQMVEGNAVRLGAEGTVDTAALQRHAVTEADLREALHNAGITEASGTRLIVLEPSGKISVLKDA